MEQLDNGKPPESKWDRLIAKYDENKSEQMVNLFQREKEGEIIFIIENFIKTAKKFL